MKNSLNIAALIGDIVYSFNIPKVRQGNMLPLKNHHEIIFTCSSFH